MTCQIISAFNTAPVPEWLAILIFVAIFIAVSVVSGYFAYKYRIVKNKNSDETKNDTDISG